MRPGILLVLILLSGAALGQKPLSVFDGRSWGIVLETPEMKNVVVKNNVIYLNDAKGTLKMDVYAPPDLKPTERRPAVVFLNALGDTPGEMKAKDWGTYRTWPQLVAANGYIGISMECDGARTLESIKGVFAFIEKEGSSFGIDATRLGVYTASANVTSSVRYLMSPDAFAGIKAAVLYYGQQPQGPFRKDLPVLFVVPEGDVRGGYTSLWNEVLKNNAPWTIKMGSGLIHAFDTFNDNDDSRKIIKETLSFWKSNLDIIPAHSWPNSIGRSTLAAQYGGDIEKAASLLKQWLNDHPDDSRALWQYGDMTKRLKKYDEAEQALKKAISIDPDNNYAKADLIVVLYATNKSEEAEKYLAQAVKSGKMNRNAYASIGYSLYVLKMHEEGVKYFEKTMDLGPLSFDYYNLACGYAILGEKDKAFTALEKAASMGYNSKQQYESDSDLNSLRSDKRYQDLLAKLE
jgi:Tfp pilus assembly protein PilF